MATNSDNQFAIGDIIAVSGGGEYEVIGTLYNHNKWEDGVAVVETKTDKHFEFFTNDLSYFEKAGFVVDAAKFMSCMNKPSGIIYSCDFELLTKKASIIGARTYPRLCAKCGQFDEFAASSHKHNGEVRCYLHCN